MPKDDELIVITKTYDFILWSCNHTARFPRNHRFVLGERIERLLYELPDGEPREEPAVVPQQQPGLPACRGSAWTSGPLTERNRPLACSARRGTWTRKSSGRRRGRRDTAPSGRTTFFAGDSWGWRPRLYARAPAGRKARA
ncbi:MAG TPA: four helix bundle protein [Pirellulales bacterium]|nr:four helix bundle protein [Pirellulales bacterium]